MRAHPDECTHAVASHGCAVPGGQCCICVSPSSQDDPSRVRVPRQISLCRASAPTPQHFCGSVSSAAHQMRGGRGGSWTFRPEQQKKPTTRWVGGWATHKMREAPWLLWPPHHPPPSVRHCSCASCSIPSQFEVA